jgi:putative ABC transport system permease protein
MALRLALRALARSKLRAALTVLGILIGIAAVVTTQALGDGAKARIEGQLRTLGVNMLVVYPAAANSGGVRGAQGSASGLTDDDATAIVREVPSVGAAAPVVSTGTQVVAGGRNAATRVTGTTPDYFVVRDWDVSSGARWTESDVRAAATVCLIGQTVRQNLFSAGEDPLGATIRVGRMPCTVVGVLAAKGQSSFGQDQDDTILVPLTTFRARLARRNNSAHGVDQIMVSARDPLLVARAERGVTSLLEQRHRVAPGAEPDFSVRNLSELLKTFDAQRAAISALLLAIASISLLVGGIGVMNIMLVSVTERTREIGIRLAIGARARDVMAQFLTEAVALATIGGIAGLGCGIVASQLLAKTTQYSVKFAPATALLAVVVSGGTGIVFGFFPARRAAKLDPIDALRHE